MQVTPQDTPDEDVLVDQVDSYFDKLSNNDITMIYKDYFLKIVKDLTGIRTIAPLVEQTGIGITTHGTSPLFTQVDLSTVRETPTELIDDERME